MQRRRWLGGLILVALVGALILARLEPGDRQGSTFNPVAQTPAILVTDPAVTVVPAGAPDPPAEPYGGSHEEIYLQDAYEPTGDELSQLYIDEANAQIDEICADEPAAPLC